MNNLCPADMVRAYPVGAVHSIAPDRLCPAVRISSGAFFFGAAAEHATSIGAHRQSYIPHIGDARRGGLAGMGASFANAPLRSVRCSTEGRA